MRGAVVGAAVLMAAAIGGIGVFTYGTLSGSKARPVKVSRAGGGDQDAPRDRRERRDKPGGPRAVRPASTIDEPADAPAAPRVPSQDDPGGSDEPRPPGPATGGRFVPGARPLGGTVGGPGDPGLPFNPGGPVSADGGTTFLPGQIQDGNFRNAGSACSPGMVDIGSFCIDANEVTNISYGSFLAARPNRRLQPQACQWNLDYTPSGGAPPPDNRPVVGVDWCDAWLYCAWSGKRLCGKMGGGNNSPGSFADASRSEWHSVCTNAGASAYSYGDAFDGTKCAHAGDDGTLAPVGAVASCVGTTPPYDQVFDMSGNAWEWEDSCAGTAGEKDLCRARGGGTHSSSAEVSCGMDYLARRDQTFKTVGIRCCSNRRPGF